EREQAVLELRPRLLRVDAGRKGDVALESSGRQLANQTLLVRHGRLLTGLLLRLCWLLGCLFGVVEAGELAANANHVVFDRHVDILWSAARAGHAHDEVVSALAHVDRRDTSHR